MKRVPHRLERVAGLVAIGAAALRHVGAPAAALPAERRDRGLDEVDRRDGGNEVVGDADGDTGAAVVGGDERGHAGAEALLHRVDLAAKVLGIEAVDNLAEESVAALVATNDGRASVAVGVTDDLVATVSAVDLVKAAVAALGGQGGGGRPDMAQGGGPDGDKASDALQAVREALQSVVA